MQYFACDYCGKELCPQADTRYTLRMEARPICETAALNDDTRDDHEPLDPVDVMEEWLAGTDDTPDGAAPDSQLVPSLDQAYDLCAGCYRRIWADPLGLDRARRFQASGH